jgi:hypothetical protein
MTKERYLDLKQRIITAGYIGEVSWAEELKPCLSEDVFALEAVWVIISSGMKNQVARIIEERIYKAIADYQPIGSVFRHKGKVKAIEYILANKAQLFKAFQGAKLKLESLKSLPWIGDITKYHLAKNLGLDMVKPDRHLVRIAEKEGKIPYQLCKEISDLTGDKVSVVDTVIWRAANLGMI